MLLSLILVILLLVFGVLEALGDRRGGLQSLSH